VACRETGNGALGGLGVSFQVNDFNADFILGGSLGCQPQIANLVDSARGCCFVRSPAASRAKLTESDLENPVFERCRASR
jgi:hypothetical protein